MNFQNSLKCLNKLFISYGSQIRPQSHSKQNHNAMDTIELLTLFDEPLTRLLFVDSYTWEAISGTAKTNSPDTGKHIYTTHCRLACTIKTKRSELNEGEAAAMQDIIIDCLRNASPVHKKCKDIRLKLLATSIMNRVILFNYELIYEC